jgi:hypothetical protein
MAASGEGRREKILQVAEATILEKGFYRFSLIAPAKVFSGW